MLMIIPGSLSFPFLGKSVENECCCESLMFSKLSTKEEPNHVINHFFLKCNLVFIYTSSVSHVTLTFHLLDNL